MDCDSSGISGRPGNDGLRIFQPRDLHGQDRFDNIGFDPDPFRVLAFKLGWIEFRHLRKPRFFIAPLQKKRTSHPFSWHQLSSWNRDPSAVHRAIPLHVLRRKNDAISRETGTAKGFSNQTAF